MHNQPVKWFLIAVCVSFLALAPTGAPQAGEDQNPGETSPAAGLHLGANRAAEALVSAMAALQQALDELPAEASDKARVSIQRNLDRLQAAHDRAAAALSPSYGEEAGTPDLRGLDRAVDSLQKAMARGSSQLQKLLDAGSIPPAAAPHFERALGGLQEGLTLALGVLDRIRTEERAGRAAAAGVDRPARPGRPDRGAGPGGGGRPQPPNRPEREGGRP